MINITTSLIKNNTTYAPNRQIEYLIIHDTGNKSIGANAKMHSEYFKDYQGSSADFFVDDKSIYQLNDYRNNYSWSCGDGRGIYGITNRNSVAIEVCVNADGNYDIAVENAIDLACKLIVELNLPVAKMVRHWDASRKLCPASMSGDNWSKWAEFKNRVAGGLIRMGWKEIIGKTTSSPDAWIKCINTAVAMAKAEGNIGDLETLQWLPDLIEKIYNNKGV